MKVTVLMENSAPDGLIGEHGLSFYIEYGGGHYLLDAGECGAVLYNAGKLGVDLAGVEKAALSHGHYDHADGFNAFFAVNRTAPVYARPRITDPEYWEEKEYIGVNPGMLCRHEKRFDLAEGPRDLAPGLHLIPDRVKHEQSLVAETSRGLVVFNSCCHAGVVKILTQLKEQFPPKTIRAVLGGFHLMGKGGVTTLGPAPEKVRAIAAALRDGLEVGAVYTGHCTGGPAYAILKEELGDRLHPLTTGALYEFED
ncbi:MBL fold metallo-hydrolase [Intestinimonas massiliensis (ex Afouda et al. 2020)]|uniref:MBL fold metallo-hydrolase n=1 Tax=Intestinimonas massiliensis (ex Afouda et al. 2020) TaxID=1673721 RepID=UPI00103123C9|nr:MBL fold metallo-hydrolase [Intestinimonas massiliensis (ex Afouda et al. 2020)]